MNDTEQVLAQHKEDISNGQQWSGLLMSSLSLQVFKHKLTGRFFPRVWHKTRYMFRVTNRSSPVRSLEKRRHCQQRAPSQMEGELAAWALAGVMGMAGIQSEGWRGPGHQVPRDIDTMGRARGKETCSPRGRAPPFLPLAGMQRPAAEVKA